MSEHFGAFLPPTRILLTPGPSSIDSRVSRAMAAPMIGHLDPWFSNMLSEVQSMLRSLFQTNNRITFPVSASGSGGMETAVVNLLEPDDECIVCVNGAFSERIAIISDKTRARVIRVETPYGRVTDPDDVRRAGKGKKIKFVALTHGETSSGVLQNLDAYRAVADELGALLVVDSVATLAGVPMSFDRQHIDISFSATQKAISAPPGLAPITVNSRAEEVIRGRKTPVQSWYFDLAHMMSYWGNERLYHHTPAVSLLYALREALCIVMEEGLDARWQRHAENARALWAGIEAMELELLVANPGDRLPTVTTVKIPAGLEDKRVRDQLLQEFNIEIAGGLGPWKGKAWRIGLMGHSSQRNNVLLFLAAFEKVLLDQGFRVPSGAGVGAAVQSYLQPQTVDVSVPR